MDDNEETKQHDDAPPEYVEFRPLLSHQQPAPASKRRAPQAALLPALRHNVRRSSSLKREVEHHLKQDAYLVIRTNDLRKELKNNTFVSRVHGTNKRNFAPPLILMNSSQAEAYYRIGNRSHGKKAETSKSGGNGNGSSKTGGKQGGSNMRYRRVSTCDSSRINHSNDEAKKPIFHLRRRRFLCRPHESNSRPRAATRPSACSDPSRIIPIRLSPADLESVAEAKQSEAESRRPNSLLFPPFSSFRLARFLRRFSVAVANARSFYYWYATARMELVEFGHDGCKDGMVKSAVEDTWTEPDMVQNNFTCKPVQAEVHGNFFGAPEDEVEVESLFFDPLIEKDLNNDIMLMGSGHVKEGLAINDFAFAVDYANQKVDFGEYYSGAALMQKHDVKYEFVDSLLQGVNDGSFHAQSNFCNDSPNFLLDGYAESLEVKFTSQSTSCIRNLRTELESKNIDSHSDAGEISDLSNPLNSPNEAHLDQDALFHDDSNINQLPDAFRSNLRQDSSVEDKHSLKRHTLCGFQNLTEIDNFSSPFKCCSTVMENEDEMIWMPNDIFGVSSPFESIYDNSEIVGICAEEAGHSRVGSFTETREGGIELLNLDDEESGTIANKRLRKRTRRYIEESTDLKSRSCKETRGPVLQKPREQCTSRGHPRKNAAAMGNETISKDEFISPAEPRAIYSLRFPKSESWKNGSEDYTKATRNEKCGIRRKHHRVWTLPEVMKLIEGVSRYGVGKWTEIKRLLFPTSPFRTSVDLKDKWRNLLRASAAQMHNRKQAGSHKKNNMSLPIPQYVLRRIKELSAIHPYPRGDRNSRVVPISSTSNHTSGNSRSVTIQKRCLT
ncbi:hypothetical protein Cni_G14955 [Canna indica]|uniref:Uncharacterized protein n=1 Tax=Canna indica TaxID=4628 RepID=A0AAQ3QEG2_9LILI|nr:hypothetical protein Cni_G14955 [Canna indica]